MSTGNCSTSYPIPPLASCPSSSQIWHRSILTGDPILWLISIRFHPTIVLPSPIIIWLILIHLSIRLGSPIKRTINWTISLCLEEIVLLPIQFLIPFLPIHLFRIWVFAGLPCFFNTKFQISLKLAGALVLAIKTIHFSGNTPRWGRRYWIDPSHPDLAFFWSELLSRLADLIRLVIAMVRAETGIFGKIPNRIGCEPSIPVPFYFCVTTVCLKTNFQKKYSCFCWPDDIVHPLDLVVRRKPSDYDLGRCNFSICYSSIK